MELKEIINLLDDKELAAIESIRYDDCDTIHFVFTIDGKNPNELQTVELGYTKPDDFTLTMYSYWEGEHSDFVDQEAFFFITNVIQKLCSKDPEVTSTNI